MLTKRRIRLAPESVRYVVCLRDQGLYNKDDSDVEEDFYTKAVPEEDSEGDKSVVDKSTSKTLFLGVCTVPNTNLSTLDLPSIPRHLRPSEKAPLLRQGQK